VQKENTMMRSLKNPDRKEVWRINTRINPSTHLSLLATLPLPSPPPSLSLVETQTLIKSSCGWLDLWPAEVRHEVEEGHRGDCYNS
jgi:hypothetical protein